MTNLRPGGYDERYHGGAIALGGGEIFDELFDLEDLNLLVGFFFGGWHGGKIISIDIAVGGSSRWNEGGKGLYSVFAAVDGNAQCLELEIVRYDMN